MRKYILFISAILTFTACQQSLEERAAEEAKTYTRKNCPMILDNKMIMDSMTFDKASHTFSYYYTFTGVMDDENVMRPEAMREELVNGIKNMTEARAYMNEGYAFQYVYRSQKSPEKILFETLITEKDYK